MDEDERTKKFVVRPHTRLPGWWEVVLVWTNGAVEVADLRAYVDASKTGDPENVVNAFATREEAERWRLRLKVWA